MRMSVVSSFLLSVTLTHLHVGHRVRRLALHEVERVGRQPEHGEVAHAQEGHNVAAELARVLLAL